VGDRADAMGTAALGNEGWSLGATSGSISPIPCSLQLSSEGLDSMRIDRPIETHGCSVERLVCEEGDLPLQPPARSTYFHRVRSIWAVRFCSWLLSRSGQVVSDNRRILILWRVK
jgi:hypothetical protein